MPQIMMTFDLEDANPDDYEPGYKDLAKQGLSRVSKNERIRLPASTVMGTTDLGGTAEEIRDALKSILAEATGRTVARISVVVVSDWACSGNVDKNTYLREIVARVMADPS